MKKFLKIFVCFLFVGILAITGILLGDKAVDKTQSSINILQEQVTELTENVKDLNGYLAESEEKLKSLLMKVKDENEKAGLCGRG